MSVLRRLGSVRDVLPVGVAALATLALVLPFYTRRPFWFDELVSIEIASLDARSFLDYVFTVESNMGLYHAVLAPWLALGGGEAWVRALSIFFALATLPYLYALGTRLFDRRTAAIAVLLLGVNVSFVGHARDARGYALALLLVTASSYHLVRAASGGGRRHWVLYAVAAGLAVWTHLLAGLVIVAQVVWLFLERRRVPRRQALLALAGLSVLLLPLALAIVVGAQGAQLDWLERPRLRQLPGLFEWFVESRMTLVLFFIGGVIALRTAIREWRSGPALVRRNSLLLLVLWLALPPIAVYALSFASPLYLYRYFLVCLPALVLLVAAGFARLQPAWLGIALSGATLASSGQTVVSCQPDCKIRHDEWGAAADYLEQRAHPGDAIVVYPAQIRTPLDHHLRPQRPRLLYPERWTLVGGEAEGSSSLAGALKRVGAGRRIWLVTWWLPSEPARTALRARGTLLDEREFPGNARLELYRLGRGR